MFNNPNGVKSKADKLKSFPNVALNSLSTDLNIDTILLRNMSVSYTEFNTKSNEEWFSAGWRNCIG